MENATKALLIAGSVLIAIVLIAVGLKILNSTSGVTKQVETVSTTMEVSIFNSQFTKYEGAQKGTAVNSLIRLITQNNATNERQITGLNNVPTIDTRNTYYVTFGIDDNTGYINSVTISSDGPSGSLTGSSTGSLTGSLTGSSTGSLSGGSTDAELEVMNPELEMK